MKAAHEFLRPRRLPITKTGKTRTTNAASAAASNAQFTVHTLLVRGTATGIDIGSSFWVASLSRGNVLPVGS
jgi:hypothetical protein